LRHRLVEQGISRRRLRQTHQTDYFPRRASASLGTLATTSYSESTTSAIS
jgi:hypothetical protein